MAKICPIAVIEDWEDIAKIYVLRIELDFSFIPENIENLLIEQTSFVKDFPDYFRKEGYMLDYDEDWCVDIEI